MFSLVIKTSLAVLILTGVFVWPIPTSTADTVSFTSSKDNTLYESLTGDLSNGVGHFLFAGKTGVAAGPLNRRAVLAFDLSSVPTNATIDNVTLTMFMSRTISGSQNISLHRVTSNWGEGTSDAGGEEGSGTLATSGDATWIHTFRATNFWNAAGGDFVGAASSTIPVDAVGSYTWGSSPAMINDVQNWLANPTSNFGWLLMGNEATSTTAKQFYSRENPAIANRPTLTINFTPVPEPSAGIVVLLSAAASQLLRRRRRRRRDLQPTVHRTTDDSI